MSQVVCIGECMVELAPAGKPDQVKISFGGDTLNTAVYLARLLGDRFSVSYMTRLGDDGYSQDMIAAWQAEGINTALVESVPDRVADLYAIQVDETGERSFAYWRDQAPARELFIEGNVAARPKALSGANAVFLSGITLSILPDSGHEKLLAALIDVGRTGATIVFDPNHRSRCWHSTDQARLWYARAYGATTIAMVGAQEEADVFGDASPQGTLDRISAGGCSEIVVRNGDEPLIVQTTEGRRTVSPEPAVRATDTTAVGDPFNAGYLAGRLMGLPPVEAAQTGHRLAAAVIQHPGAIIPKDNMPYFPATPQ